MAETISSGLRSVYEFESYKEFLRDRIARNRQIHGYQSRLATAAGCQRSFLSQALNTHIHLTPEHASALAEHFEMNDDERAYWLDLLILERSGTADLRQFQLRKIRKAQDRMRLLAKRYAQKKITASDQAAEYYATWMPAATHILLTIPEFRTVPRIARRLGIAREAALATLRTLKRIGLAEEIAGEWRCTQKSIHLPQGSPFNVQNHRNFREIALQESAFNRGTAVHYTGVYSLSREDHGKLQALLLGFLDETRKRVIDSKEEILSVFLCDFFELERG